MRKAALLFLVLAAVTTGARGASGQPLTPPISKIAIRQLPPKLAIRHVLGQLGDLLLAPSQPAASDDDPPLTDSQKQKILSDLSGIIAAMPDAVAAPASTQRNEADVRRTLENVANVITIWPDPYLSPHPRAQLRQMTFQTRVYATRTPNLCAVDMVTVMFEPAGSVHGAYTKARPSDVQFDRYYRFLQPPTAALSEQASPAQRHETDLSCAKLKSDDLHLMAPDEAQAVRGTWLAQAVLSGIRATPVPFRADCTQLAINGDCSYARRGDGDVSSIANCAPSGDTCDVMSGGLGAEIAVDGASSKIEAVVFKEYVVIADAMID